MKAYRPEEVARLVESAGAAKARAPAGRLFTLALLGGAFIALGSLVFLVAVSDSELGAGPTRLLGGAAFSLGLFLVVVAGAELFTGNNLLAMAWASRKIDAGDVLRNWTIVYAGNVVGALATAGIASAADPAGMRGAAAWIAEMKGALPPLTAFARGVLCNGLVCLAVWMAMAGRGVADKAVAVLFPVTAFVAAGFEHSVANWFFLPFGMMHGADVTVGQVIGNLVTVTAGNIVGGTILVAAVYWLAYLREPREPRGRRRRSSASREPG